MTQCNSNCPQLLDSTAITKRPDSNIRNLFSSLPLPENPIFSFNELACIFRLVSCYCTDCSEYIKHVTLYSVLWSNSRSSATTACDQQNGTGEGNTAVKNLNIQNTQFQHSVIHSVLTGMNVVNGYSIYIINYKFITITHPVLSPL
jgi:hypothetical protein